MQERCEAGSNTFERGARFPPHNPALRATSLPTALRARAADTSNALSTHCVGSHLSFIVMCRVAIPEADSYV